MNKKILLISFFIIYIVQAYGALVTVRFTAPASTPENAVINVGTYGAGYETQPITNTDCWKQMTKLANNVYTVDLTFGSLTGWAGLRFILNNDVTNIGQFKNDQGNYDVDNWKDLASLTGNLWEVSNFIKWKNDITRWQMKTAPIMTKWSESIDPNNVLGEYPRPQLQRHDWLNLNGIWSFKTVAAKEPYSSAGFFDEILVPFPVESAISGIMQSQKKHVWYKRTFNVPQAWIGKRIRLNFGAVDWETELFVNGQSVGTHNGGYDPFSFDITDKLTASGLQELAVRVYDPTEDAGGDAGGGQPVGKQTNHPSAIFYTATTGIWQTVWAEPVADTHIRDLKMIPDIDKSRLNLTVNVDNVTAQTIVSVVVKDGTMIVASQDILANQLSSISIPNQKLWSPDTPFLYSLEIKVKNGDAITDNADSYFGMRKVSMGEWNGKKRIMLNNKYLFNFGVLDQGFWPDGLYTAPTDSALIWDIQKIKEYGFNTSRKHIKVEPARWYYHCDRLGIMVWQDMVSMPLWPGEKDNNMNDPVIRANYKIERNRTIEALKNNPSIVLWTVFNEGWGQFNTIENTKEVIALDSSRLVSCASGWDDFEVGNIIDKHNYQAPALLNSDTRISVLGEYGGIGLYVADHAWAYRDAIYGGEKNDTAVCNRFNLFTERVDAYAKKLGLSAAIYTQLSDVETETNGLVTYDRKINKGLVDLIHPRIEYVIKNCSVNDDDFTTIFSMSDTWKYTTVKPTDNWISKDFNDNAWATGNGGFGSTGNDVSFPSKTVWNTPDLWMRKTFNPGNLSDSQIQNIFADMLIDGTIDVTINGVPAVTFPEELIPIPEHHFYHLSPAAKNAIKVNQNNVISVHCNNGVGGAYFSLGLSVNNKLLISTSVNQITLKSNSSLFNIYPNPASNEATIRFSIPLSQNEIIEIFSIAGLKVAQIPVSKETTRIYIALRKFNLTNGVYIVKLKNQNNQLVVK